MRVFLAIDVDDEVRQRVAALARELRPKVPRARFVPEGNLHMTLRFLGETTKEKVEGVASALSRTTGTLSGFAIAFRGLGVFPNPRRARVLWVGTTNAPEDLFVLQSSVEKVVREQGFEPERGRFHPHLTIARFRDPPRKLAAILKVSEGREFGSTRVRALVLYQSTTSPDGSSYRPLRSFPLSLPDDS